MGWEWVNNGKDFLWISEKDGWRQIYLISQEGKKETLLTSGNYDMIDFCGVDEKNGYVYFTASPNHALQKYLYKVKIDGTAEAELVTSPSQQGTHSYQVSPNGLFAKHNFSSASIPPSEEWVNLQTGLNIKGEIKNTPNKKNNVDFIKITTEDGITMDGWMIFTKKFRFIQKIPCSFFMFIPNQVQQQ
jgi:dipeptidyl-peptidase-4